MLRMINNKKALVKSLSYLSQALTLEPGDVIFTGTPSGVSPVHPGDVMEMRIQGIGSLINPVAAEPL